MTSATAQPAARAGAPERHGHGLVLLASVVLVIIRLLNAAPGTQYLLPEPQMTAKH